MEESGQALQEIGGLTEGIIGENALVLTDSRFRLVLNDFTARNTLPKSTLTTQK